MLQYQTGVNFKKATFIACTLLAAFFGFFAGDRLLGFLGFFDETPIQITHPKNYFEKRKNIEFEYDFRTNSQGLRYREIPLDKQGKEVRWIVLGDSYVEGVGVDTQDRFTEILEDRFSTEDRKVYFINGGLQGAGPENYARILYRTGLKYNPDKILLMIYANDLGDTKLSAEIGGNLDWLENRHRKAERRGLKAFLHRLFPHTYILAEQVLQKSSRHPRHLIRNAVKHARRKGIAEERIYEWLENLPEYRHAAERGEFNPYFLIRDLFNPNFWTESLDVEGEEAQAKWEQMEKILDTIALLAKSRHLELKVVYAPAPYQYDPAFSWLSRSLGGVIRAEWLTDESELERRLALWAERGRLPFLNLTPFFRDEFQKGTPLHYPLDGHWTRSGNRFVADIIADWLKRDRAF